MTAPADRPLTTLVRLGGRGVPTELARWTRAERRRGLDAPVVVQRQRLTPNERRARNALVELVHPNLGVVHELLDDGSDTLVVSAYVEGECLASLRAASPTQRLPLEVELRIALDVLAGLGGLHGLSARDPSAAKLHGQLDPRNVIVQPSGVATLVQLGGPPPLVAEDTWYRYLAPELLLGDDTVDSRVDLYSVGAVLWEALSGAPFLPDKSPNAILVRHLSGKIGAPPIPSDAPWASALSPLLVRAVSTDPSARFESAGAFAEALRAAAGDHVASAEAVQRTVSELGGAAIEARRARLAKLDPSSTKRAPAAAPATTPAAPPPTAAAKAPPPKLQLPSALRASSPSTPTATAPTPAAKPIAKAPAKAPSAPKPSPAIVEASDLELSPPSQRITTPAPAPPPARVEAKPIVAPTPTPPPARVEAKPIVAPTPMPPPARVEAEPIVAPTPPPPAPVERAPIVAPALDAAPLPATLAAAPVQAPPPPPPARTQLAMAPPPPPPPEVAPVEELDVVLGPPSVPPSGAHAKSDPAGPAIVPSVPPPPPSRRSRGLLVALALFGLLGIAFAAMRLGGGREETHGTAASATSPHEGAAAKPPAKDARTTATTTTASVAPEISAASASASASAEATGSIAAAAPEGTSPDARTTTGPTSTTTTGTTAATATTATTATTAAPARTDRPKSKPANTYDPLGI